MENKMLVLGKKENVKFVMTVIMDNQKFDVWADHLVRLSSFMRKNVKRIYKICGFNYKMTFKEQMSFFSKPYSLAHSFGINCRKNSKEDFAYMKHPSATCYKNGKTYVEMI